MTESDLLSIGENTQPLEHSIDVCAVCEINAVACRILKNQDLNMRVKV